MENILASHLTYVDKYLFFAPSGHWSLAKFGISSNFRGVSQKYVFAMDY